MESRFPRQAGSAFRTPQFWWELLSPVPSLPQTSSQSPVPPAEPRTTSGEGPLQGAWQLPELRAPKLEGHRGDTGA